MVQSTRYLAGLRMVMTEHGVLGCMRKPVDHCFFAVGNRKRKVARTTVSCCLPHDGYLLSWRSQQTTPLAQQSVDCDTTESVGLGRSHACLSLYNTCLDGDTPECWLS